MIARADPVPGTADALAEAMASLLSPADLVALAGGWTRTWSPSSARGRGPSIDGWLDGDLAFLTDWGFSADDVTVPTTLWQDSEDLMVPFSHGR